MDTQLIESHCAPLQEGATPLTPEEQAPLFDQLNEEWEITEDGIWLEREYDFADFKEALAFVNQVGEVAELVFFICQFGLYCTA